MATTLRFRQKQNGIIASTATIRIYENREVVYQETKTFSKSSSAQNKAMAELWARKREAELEINGIPILQANYTLSDLTDLYMDDPLRTLGRTKLFDLQKLKSYPIADKPINSLTSQDYTQHINSRLKTVKPQTAGNDLIWIGVLLDFARVELNAKADMDELRSAKKHLKSVGKIARSEERERLPTPEEHKKLLEYFKRRQSIKSDVPMLDILLFAMYSTRRLSEITRIKWQDNDGEFKTGIVRDAKHPKHKIGNNRTFNYGEEAWTIMKRQKSTGEFIFPYNAKTLSAYFTNACKLLGINDLKFHDYRHWGASEKFVVKGLHIHEVAEYTLHEDWKTLKRYTHLSPREKKQVIEVHELTKTHCEQFFF